LPPSRSHTAVGVVQQQSHHRRGAQRLGIGGQGTGLVPVQARGGVQAAVASGSTTGRVTPWVGTRPLGSWAAQYR
jgi:hypothetical protein